MHRIGVLGEQEKKLDYVLGLTIEQFLNRRLQTIVSETKNAKSTHEARSLIFQKRISINHNNRSQIVNVPSYIVRKENESYIHRDQKENDTSRTRRRTIRRNEEKAANNNNDD